MPLVQTRGAASAQGFGEFAQASGPVIYIEEVFSTYLYTGNGTTQTITNGIDLSTKGGMVWTKSRSVAKDNGMWDTVRGAGTGSGSPNNKTISSNGLNLSAFYSTDYLSSFSTTGFNVTYGDATYSVANQSGTTYVGWAFRKQPKFFDIQTWTGNGTAGKTITHALGSVPGCIMVLCTTTNYSWFVYHRSANAGGNTTSLMLNSTSAAANDGDGGIQNLTSTTFALGGAGAYSTRLNDSGQTYIAYIFAHDAGGFGLTGTDNVISCGSFATDASGNATVNLGYEPQWLLIKSSSNADNWKIGDNMRGWTTSEFRTVLPNLTNAEGSSSNPLITSTGFQMVADNASRTFIYIAIRRGPMKVPTSGTSVYNAVARTGTGATAVVNTTITADAFLIDRRNSAGNAWGELSSRLTGASKSLWTTQTYAEITDTTEISNIGMDSITLGTSSTVNSTAGTYINWFFKRAPSFMDVVCYTGTGTASQVLTHNLTVIPTLTIFKKRSAANPWDVVSGNTSYMQLNATNAATPDTSIAATSTTITAALGAGNGLNASGATYVAYLFATCAGVSKVGSYTGTGATQTIDCGFGAGGSRFVLIKRTDSTGDWYVWDSARGMTSGTDPSLLLNDTAAEVNANSVYAISTGFQIVSTAAGINASAGTYIFLSVA